MRGSFKPLFGFAFLNLYLVCGLVAQPWNFVKEKDGIKIYTRVEQNHILKSSKGEAVFHAPIEKIYALLGNPKNTDWWDKGIKEIKVLAYDRYKLVQYYLVYKMPWPMVNRYLVTETRITSDPLTGDRKFSTKPLPDVVPEKADVIRIRNYHQSWTLHPIDKEHVLVTFEGYVDPGGNIPSWFYNIVVAETPLRTIRSLRERVLSDKPASW